MPLKTSKEKPGKHVPWRAPKVCHPGQCCGAEPSTEALGGASGGSRKSQEWG